MDEPSVSKMDKLRGRIKGLRTRARGMLPFVSGVLATLFALILFNFIFPNTQMTESEVRDVIDSTLASATPRTPDAVQVYENVRYSIVLIEVTGEGGDGLGAGVVIDLFGDILTSHHVVADSTDITVTFADGSKSTAFILSETPEQDIAVLRAFNTPDFLVPATLGNPGAMRVGDDVFAIGHPFGLTGSLTSGVISGFGRSFQPPGSDIPIQELIQFDAAVNPGSSGGPLLNRNGQVIGIVTGIISPEEKGSFAGVGFAVPITNAIAGGSSAPPY